MILFHLISKRMKLCIFCLKVYVLRSYKSAEYLALFKEIAINKGSIFKQSLKFNVIPTKVQLLFFKPKQFYSRHTQTLVIMIGTIT